jgi:hypothetical protein
MDTPTRVVFFSGLAAFALLFVWMLSLTGRVTRLARQAAARHF